MWNNWNKVNETSLGILSPIAFLGPSRVATENGQMQLWFLTHRYKEMV